MLLIALSENSRYRYLFFRAEEQWCRAVLHLTDYCVTLIGLTTNQIRNPVLSGRRTILQLVNTFSCIGGTSRFITVFTGTH
jgi:hypothetical protein